MIAQPRMTPMYRIIWKNLKKDNEIPDLAIMKTISNKLGIYSSIHLTKWIHVCHPVLARRYYADRLWKWHTPGWYIKYNYLGNHKCSCGYKLTKQEQILIKLALLGIKR